MIASNAKAQGGQIDIVVGMGDCPLVGSEKKKKKT